MKITKVFFLMEKETSIGRFFNFYGFVPYKFGPYSFEMFKDIETLIVKDQINAVSDTELEFQGGTPRLPFAVTRIMDKLAGEYTNIPDKEILKHVYANYPRFTIFSEIEKKEKYKRDLTGVLTIGYEGKSVDRFLMDLINEKVHTLVDIRNNPWSMKWGFKKNTLDSFSTKLGIEYVGYPELGIPKNLRRDLQTLEDYNELFEKYKVFIKSRNAEIEELVGLSGKKRIALLCFEKDPNYCHRKILGQELERRGSEVKYT